MPTENQHLLTDQIADWITVTIDRPAKRNALDGEMMTALIQTLGTVGRADQPVKGITLCGGTEGFFCAGVDLKFFTQVYVEAQAGLADPTSQLFEALESFPKPLVGMAGTGARAAGVGLLAACDYVIADAQASFAVGGARLGVPPTPLVQVLRHKVGIGAARRLLLSGEQLNAKQAQQLGLVDFVAPSQDAARAKLYEIKRAFKASGPRALAATKAALLGRSGPSFGQIMSGDEAKEGLRAFVEKRAPSWVKSDD